MQAKTSYTSEKARVFYGTMVQHFAHKIKVTETAHGSQLHFPCGCADVWVDGPVLHIEATAESPELLADTCDVVERHLLRFAHREAPEPFVWQQN